MTTECVYSLVRQRRDTNRYLVTAKVFTVHPQQGVKSVVVQTSDCPISGWFTSRHDTTDFSESRVGVDL